MSTPLVQSIGRPGASGQARRMRVLAAIWCFTLLAGIKLSLCTFGFRATRRILARLTSANVTADDDCTEIVNATAERVAVAAAFFPGRARCLEQSLTLWYLLRQGGMQATLRLGVQPYPFAAHAWVEHAGEPINEKSETLKAYVAFPALPDRIQ